MKVDEGLIRLGVENFYVRRMTFDSTSIESRLLSIVAMVDASRRLQGY